MPDYSIQMRKVNREKDYLMTNVHISILLKKIIFYKGIICVLKTFIHTDITWPPPQRGFSGPMEANNANEHNEVKNPNWQEADQLAIYKRGRGVELGSTKKQLQLSGQSGTRTRDLRIQSPAP